VARIADVRPHLHAPSHRPKRLCIPGHAVALYKNVKPTATAAQIKSAILGSAVPTASLTTKTVTGGRLDANGALSR
jgi:hypothetical protein